MYVRAWMSLNFDQILLLTTELAAFEHLKDVSVFSRGILYRSFSNLQVTRTYIIHVS